METGVVPVDLFLDERLCRIDIEMRPGSGDANSVLVFYENAYIGNEQDRFFGDNKVSCMFTPHQ